jgi:hypothetical protein
VSISSITTKLERLTRSSLSPSLARKAKRVAVYLRYAAQTRACRDGYRRYGSRYPQKVLFIAGLPKSGTTLLKRMISSYPGFHDLLIPDVARYEFASGGGLDYELPFDMFRRFKDMLVVTKMHVHGSPHNVEVLRSAGVKYVVLYRDLRDVAVSHYFYVRQTPWHPDHPAYAKLSITEALVAFANRSLLPHAEWVRSWHSNRDPKMSLELRYEEFVSDTVAVIKRVGDHFDLDSSLETVQEIVSANSFKKLSGGRVPGQQDETSFFRKGVSGDWVNFFTPETKAIYKSLIGQFLIEFGYENSDSW